MGTSKNSCAGVFYVYFSSGVGRTGCFIALDLLVDEGEEDHSVDVCKCVARLREQRVNMVQYEVRTVLVKLRQFIHCIEHFHLTEKSKGITVNSKIFARTLFSRNFAYAKFRGNKTPANWQNYSVVY